LQIPTLPAQGSQSQSAQGSDTQNPITAGSLADMPLPSLPVTPPPAQPDQTPLWQTKFPDPPYLIATVPAGSPPKRQTHGAPAPSAHAPKPQVQSYYMEKYVDQGEYHYRRRPCEPPNMPDVCFMPQAARQPVLAAKP
jgi:hypothetical protein